MSNKQNDTTVVVRNTQTRALVLPPSAYPKGTTAAAMKPLLPGENTLDASVWEKAKKNPAVKEWRHAGILTMERKGQANRTGLEWASVPEEKAAPIIEKMVRVEQLHEIKTKAKGNPVVIELCNLRIEQILKDADKE